MSAVDVFGSLFRKVKERSRKDNDQHGEQDRSQRRRRAYLVLIQHTRGASTRQLAANTGATDADRVVYERAGLRTPGENAARDLEGGPLWIQHVTRKLSEVNDHVIWLQTVVSKRHSAFIKSLPNNFILNVSSDPYGWDQAETSESVVNLLDLESIVRAVEERLQSFATSDREMDSPNATCGLAVQSLSPILQCHGFQHTIHFLRKLQTMFSTVVIAISSDSLTDVQRSSLQDLAEALLFLEQGEATLLRKGVREEDSVVRENIPFDIATDATGRRHIVQVNMDNLSNDVAALAVGAKIDKVNERKHTERAGRKPKVELQLEEEKELRPNKPTTTRPPDQPDDAPRFFLEENDPEFDDYDEEDPDDDLDM